MTDKILYCVTLASATFALMLFVTNANLVNGNINLQAQINQRQMVINTASNVLPLNQQLSNAIYDASIKTNDETLRTLLISQGFTLPTKADKTTAPKVAEETKTKKPASSSKVEE